MTAGLAEDIVRQFTGRFEELRIRTGETGWFRINGNGNLIHSNDGDGDRPDREEVLDKLENVLPDPDLSNT